MKLSDLNTDYDLTQRLEQSSRDEGLLKKVSSRTFNALARAGFKTPGQVVDAMASGALRFEGPKAFFNGERMQGASLATIAEIKDLINLYK